MKVLFLPFLFLTLNVFSQKATVKPKTSSQASTFSKRLSADSLDYFLSDMVAIKNGKEESVKVSFRASIPVEVWKDYVKRYHNKEKDLFLLISSILSLNAQYTLKNTLSFEPIKSQFFMYDKENKVFMSNFKMMGRNGYGNLVETSEIVRYDLEPDLK